jgi:hypothetical protein
MCGKLGIELIAASSPQAKGRVERVHGTHQDRLVKKLRRKQMDTHAQANVYLDAEYLPEHNRRFARPAARAEDYHRRAPRAAELDKIFRLESARTISEDWVVRYDNRFFQLEPQSRHYAPAKGQVVVCEGREGSLAIEYRVERCAGSKSRRPQGREARTQYHLATPESLRRRTWGSGSGCRRLTTHGAWQPAEGRRGERRA